MAFPVTVQLSDALKTELQTPGVFGYGVYFTEQGSVANWLPLDLSDGAGNVNATQTFDITTPYSSGKIYFIIQSGGPSVKGSITQEADLSWASAAGGTGGAQNFRYDSVELTVQGNSFDVANLTDVNSFGIPMSITNGLSGPAGTRGYNQSATYLFDQIVNDPPTYNGFSAPNSNNYEWAGPLTGPRMVAGPTDATGSGFAPPAPFNASDWTNYVGAVGNALKAGTETVTISGWFNGAPDSKNLWHNAGYYAYQASFDGTYFWLDPLGSSQVKGTLRVTPANLANSIYATYGSVDVMTSHDGTVLSSGPLDNNQWNAVFRDFLTGFTGGYYGRTGTSPNGAAHGANIDLDSNANWDPTYVFGNNTTTAFGANAGYDKYAQLFYNQTNSYGSGYSDNLMKALANGPLMSLWNSGSNTPLTITLFADADTPTTATFNSTPIDMGYGGAPVMDNYIAPPGTGYVNLTDIGGDATFAGGNSFTFNFAGSNVFLDSSSTVQIGFYNGTGFTYLTVPSTADSFWNTYTLNYTPGTGPGTGFSFSTAVNPSSPGSIGITNLPVATDGSVGWYQVIVTGTGAGAWTKTFNLYATSDSTSHQFVNPNVTPGSVAADGLVVPQANDTPSPPATVLGLTFAFLTGSGFSLDPSLLERNATVETIANPGNAIYTSPFAPVIGSAKGGAFTNFMTTPGDYTVGPTPNAYQLDANSRLNPTSVIPVRTQTFADGAWFDVNLVTYTLADTVTKSKIAFSWWASDTNWTSVNANQTSLLDHTPATDIIWDGTGATAASRWNPANLEKGYQEGQYTNKVGAGNTAIIEFVTSDASGTYASHAPISVKADLDGVWTTANKLFINGTYKAVLMEYDPLMPGVAVNKASDGVVFTIDGTGGGGGGGSISGGSSISFNPGTSSAEGTWVHLDTMGSTLLNGTLYVYFTDANGALLSRIDDSVTTSLSDAVRGQIGLVKTDGGGLMFDGTQSIYLPVGMQMKFAVQVGNDSITPLPGIQVSGSDSLSVVVLDPSGTVNLTARIDNSPGANANLALSQQEFDKAWVYLTQGQTVHIDVKGSAYNNNEIHLVRIDVDAGNPDSADGWSVGGVAWGNSSAFRDAVRSNWDAGFDASGGRGNFSVSKDWTVSDGTGYYAPVLKTEGGDIFVIGGNANIDQRAHIRVFGQNMFGFEDVKAGDWDYNDLVMKITAS